MGLGSTTKRRAVAQSQWNIETKQGTVVRSYTDGLGNVTHYDVMVHGETEAHVQVPNKSGLKFGLSEPVTINYVRGNRHFPQVTGGGGSSGLALAARQGSGAATPGGADIGTPGAGTSTGDPSGWPVLLSVGDADLAAGSVLAAGTGITLTPSTSTDPSGVGQDINILTVAATSTEDHLVISDSSDPSAGTLINKLEAGTNTTVSLDSTAHKVAVNVASAPPSGGAGGDLSGTYPNPTVARVQGQPFSGTAPADGHVWAWSGIDSRWEPKPPAPVAPTGGAGGDLSGSYPGPTVSRMQGRAVSGTAPTDGQVLTWVAADGEWEPKVAPSAVPYTLPIASGTVLGGVKIGTGLNESSDGTISAEMVTSSSVSEANSSGGISAPGSSGNYKIAIIDAAIVAGSSPTFPYTADNTYTLPFAPADFASTRGSYSGTVIIDVLNVSGGSLTVNAAQAGTDDLFRPVQARPYPATDATSVSLSDGQAMRFWASSVGSGGHGLWYYKLI